MLKLMRAMHSEHRRLWHKKSTILWLMLSAVAGAFVVFACASALNYYDYDTTLWSFCGHFSTELTQGASNDNWQSDAEAVINDSYERWNALADKAENGTYMQRAIAERERECAARESNIADYRLTNGVSPEGGNMWRVIQLALWLMMQLVCLPAAVAASDMFAGEYTRGTIYMNLARPVTRIKQYFAKLFTAWIYGALLMAAAFAGSVLSGALLLGDNGGSYVGFINGEVYQVSWPRHCLAVFGCCFASLAICIAICAALGTLTRSRAAAATGALAITLASVWLGRAFAPTLGVLSGLSIISCLDLTVPLVTSANYAGLSFADCCVSCTAHLLVFSIAGYYFMRRDIND